MSEASCPYCQTIVSEVAKFCHICGGQLRCKMCGTPIIMDAKACYECGEPVLVQSQAGQGDFDGSSIPSGYNRLRIRSTPNTYDVDLLCSDNAVEHVNDLLARLGRNHFADQGIQGDYTVARSGMQMVVESPTQSIAAPAHEAQAEQSSADSHPPLQKTTPVDSSENGIWRIFTTLDGKPVLDEIKLKAGSAK